MDHVYKLHGMPRSLVYDCDPFFTSKFWQSVFCSTGMHMKMSTINHPKTNGKMECVNKSVECYLRCFISAHPSQWAKWLPLCEFWYNTNWHSSIGKSPFELLYGHSLRYFGIIPSDQIATADVQSWLDERTRVISSVRQHLE